MSETPATGPAPGAAADTSGTKPGLRQPAEAPNLLDQGPDTAQEGGNGLTADEEAQLAKLQAKAVKAAAGRTIDVRIDQPHSEMHYGGVKVTNEFSPVPEHMIGPLTTAAADAGVKLIQKEN